MCAGIVKTTAEATAQRSCARWALFLTPRASLQGKVRRALITTGHA
jgi:hypothetical protein